MSAVRAVKALSVIPGMIRSKACIDVHQMSDEDLVSASIREDPDAFNELVMRHRSAALKVATSIVGYDRAEDVVQEAFLLAFRAIKSIRDRGRFPQWLATITRFRALRVGRLETRHTRGRVVIDEIFLESHAAPHGADNADALEMAEVLTALEAVPRHYADVVRLHFLQDLSHDSISKRLGVPLSTVKWRCFRGKGLLREQLAVNHPERPPVSDDCSPCVAEGLRVTCGKESPESRCNRRTPSVGTTLLPIRSKKYAKGGMRNDS